MRSRSIAVVAAVCAIALAGCTGGAASSKGPKEAPLTLTRENFPTAVGTKWTMVRRDGTATPISLKVSGPWKLEAGSDWNVTPQEIVDPATVPGIDRFADVTYVMRESKPDNPTFYYPRYVSHDWIDSLGRITVRGDGAIEVTAPGRVRFWPLELEVGKTYDVGEGKDYTLTATVLARNTAVVPAGTIHDTFLVRFRSKAKKGKTAPSDQYYMLAPNVGMVAFFARLKGTEKTGFTSADTVVLLLTMPSK